MTRNIPEPLPDNNATVGQDKALAVLRELLAWSVLHRHTGSLHIRINVNQGGVTAAKAFLETSLPSS